MVLSPSRQRLNLPVAPLVAALIGGLTALVFALLPVGMLEDFVIDSGIAAVLPAAEPPLGFTARTILILLGGGGPALIAWFGLFLLLGTRAIVIQRSGERESESESESAPVLRRADAHPDAPARRPVFANRDLGTPFLEVRAGRPVHAKAVAMENITAIDAEPELAERDLPVDLDTPLAAFDPHAIPEEPADWFPLPAALSQTPRLQVFDPGERFETFELTPMVRNATPVSEPTVPEPAPFAEATRPSRFTRVEIDPSASIHALLDRLERGVGRQEVPAPPPPPSPLPREDSLQEALVTLRRLATRG